MKRLTFAEFFALPPGVIFGQDYALPHRDAGLWRKGESWEATEVDDHEDAEGRSVTIVDILTPEPEVTSWVDEDEIEDDHRFLVYEPADLDRLAGIIGDARKVAQA